MRWVVPLARPLLYANLIYLLLCVISHQCLKQIAFTFSCVSNPTAGTVASRGPRRTVGEAFRFGANPVALWESCSVELALVLVSEVKVRIRRYVFPKTLGHSSHN